MTEGISDTCAQCGTALLPDQRVDTGDRSFCKTCFAALEDQLRGGIAESQKDIPYPAAVAGAILGGAAGALLWWGFTIMTKIAFGLVAVAIGFLVGQGAVRFSGGKRSRSLQVLCVVVALAAFVAASYFVNRTFINEALVKSGDARQLGVMPASMDAFYRIVTVDFGLMDVVFLAITLWEAWKIPRPLALPQPTIS
jgi:hypothetical protein